MAFVTKEELKTAIRENHLNTIVDNDDTVVAMAITAAEIEVRSYLTPGGKKVWMDGRPHYDVDAIFNAVGALRNQLLLEITKDVALWWIVRRSNAGVQYQIVESRYDRGIDYLTKLSTGEVNDASLPTLPDESDQGNGPKPFRMGSRPKFHHE